MRTLELNPRPANKPRKFSQSSKASQGIPVIRAFLGMPVGTPPRFHRPGGTTPKLSKDATANLAKAKPVSLLFRNGVEVPDFGIFHTWLLRRCQGVVVDMGCWGFGFTSSCGSFRT